MKKDETLSVQKEYAKKLQVEHTEKFQGKFVAFRTLLEVVYEQQSK